MGEDREILKNSLKQINNKRLIESMSKLPEEYEEIKRQIYEYIEDLANDYEIKMAYYDKKYYKQGFEDAVLLQCYLRE